MPIRLPLKVSISPKAINTEWWISPMGGVKSPAASNAHPKAHMAVAMMSCKRFIQKRYFPQRDDFTQVMYFPQIAQIYTEPRGSFIRQLRQ